MEESKLEGEEKPQCIEACSLEEPCSIQNLCRKEKRKALKKMKRKQLRKEVALERLQEEEARLNDPDEQRRIRLMELEEEERSERERKLFEERERAWIEAMELKKKKMAEEEEEEEEEEQRRRALEEQSTAEQQAENENELSEDWEYIEGPSEIIWKGEEIILKKKLIKVPKKKNSSEPQKSLENAHRPTSNPLPPQSEAFTDYKSASVSSRQVIEDVASQAPNFGTEQDKSHCPFHLKTGACRFGQRCSRIHFYPNKSCTLLIKNMYNGPGLAWEQDEGLEFTDEEVERCYKEFYEDVHTEFLKYGEIINFKVCKNGSFHLRGNVYVHYKSLDSAVLAYNANNGRFYAGKQVICEFINVTRWKIAICGEFMKTRYKTCSHGTACNFIHCFRNPGGDYEWADSDRPPPRYWVNEMASLFGNLDESGNDKHIEPEHRDKHGKFSKSMSTDGDRYHSRRSKSKSLDHSKDAGYGRRKNSENDYRWTRHCRREKVLEKQRSFDEEAYEKATLKDDQQRKNRFDDADSDEPVDKFEERSRRRERDKTSKGPRNQDSNRKTGVRNADHDDSKNTSNKTDEEWSSGDGDKHGHRRKRRKTSEHVSKTSKTIDGSPSSKSVTNYPDACRNRSDRSKERPLMYGKKSKRHWDEVTKYSDDQNEQKSQSKTDNGSKKSSSHVESVCRDLMNTGDSHSIDSLHSDVLSDESEVPSVSDRHVERFKPDLDEGYRNNKRIDMEGRWEPEKNGDEFEKSSETTSAERYQSGSPVQYGERIKPDVLGTVDYYGNKSNKRNQCKLKSSDLHEHRRSRRKSSRYDDDQTVGDSDEDYLQKNLRSSSHSRTKRHRRHSLEKDTHACDNYQEESQKIEKDLSSHKTRACDHSTKRE